MANVYFFHREKSQKKGKASSTSRLPAKSKYLLKAADLHHMYYLQHCRLLQKKGIFFFKSKPVLHMTETLQKDNMISSDISNCRLNSSPKHALPISGQVCLAVRCAAFKQL